jgi:hypothetical protein
MRRIEKPEYHAYVVRRPTHDVWDVYLISSLDDHAEQHEPVLEVTGSAASRGALQALADALNEHIEPPASEQTVREVRTALERAEARVDLIIDHALRSPHVNP